MSLMTEDLARAQVSARLDRAQQDRQYARLATAHRLARRAERLGRRAERLGRRAERAAAQTRLSIARLI